MPKRTRIKAQKGLEKPKSNDSDTHSAIHGNSVQSCLAGSTGPGRRNTQLEPKSPAQGMNADLPNQNGVDPTPQQTAAGSSSLANRESHEQELVSLFMQLTGESESEARNAFMFVICNYEDSKNASAYPPGSSNAT